MMSTTRKKGPLQSLYWFLLLLPLFLWLLLLATTAISVTKWLSVSRTALVSTVFTIFVSWLLLFQELGALALGVLECVAESFDLYEDMGLEGLQ